MENPEPGLKLVEKLIETKRKNDAKHFTEVRKEFSFETGIRNELFQYFTNWTRKSSNFITISTI
jgi:hypothetical protein